AQVVDGGGGFGEPGGRAQFVQDGGAVLVGRGFAQGAGEVAAGGVGGADTEGLLGCGAQLLHDPGVTVGVGLQEVAGGGGGPLSLVDHAPGGLAVQGDADAGRDGPVDGGGDQGVDELEGLG